MEIKKILVCGSNGQLGKTLKDVSILYPMFDFTFLTRDKLDITSLENVTSVINSGNYNAVVNCAAYTNVNNAETEDGRQLCVDANLHGPMNLVRTCKKNGNIPLINISTDYVFDGENHNIPYKEDNKTNPQSIYGKTKEFMEEEIMGENPETNMIIRTSWVYSKYGKNFVKTMIEKMKTSPSINVVCDQVGTPTNAKDLANAICLILTKGVKGGIFHYSNEGTTSWYDFACAIQCLINDEDIKKCKINPIFTDEINQTVKRPTYSVLDKSKIKKEYHIEIPNWLESLSSFF